MTVEELLQLPTIKGLKLISGNLGVHREISTVTVVDPLAYTLIFSRLGLID